MSVSIPAQVRLVFHTLRKPGVVSSFGYRGCHGQEYKAQSDITPTRLAAAAASTQRH